MALATWRDTAIRYINTQFLDGAVSAPPLALQFPTAGANGDLSIYSRTGVVQPFSVAIL